jgi:hypothetical protein
VAVADPGSVDDRAKPAGATTDPVDDIDLPLDGTDAAAGAGTGAAAGAGAGTAAGAAAAHAAPVSAPRRRKAKAAAPAVEDPAPDTGPAAAGPLSEPAAPPAPPAPPTAPDESEAPGAPGSDDADGVPGRRVTPHRSRSLRWLPRESAGQHSREPGTGLQVGSFFRVPLTGDPAPDNGQLIGICAWATLLGLGGLLIAIRGLVGIVGGLAPDWYQPALIIVGMVGIVLTVLAFMAIQRRYLPWIMLGLATIPLAVNIALTLSAL